MSLLENEALYREAFGARDTSSEAMRSAISRWFGLYYGGGGLLQLPYTLVRKLVRGVFAEFSLEGDGGVLAGFPHSTALELALIGGECYLRPRQTARGWQWQVIPRGSALVFRRDANGEPTAMGLTEQRLRDRFTYTLLETRTAQNGQLTLEHRLYRSTGPGTLGREVRLGEVAAYEGLPRKLTLPLEGPGLVRLRLPTVNTVDGSAEGVSILEPVRGLIEAAEENEQLLLEEFRNGRSRLVVSRDMLREGQLRDTLFVGLDEAPETVGITVFAPQLREESYLRRQAAYLRSIENTVGLKRGLLGEVEAADRTATEITSSEGEYLATLMDLRRAYEQAMARCVALAAALEGREADTLVFHWGDGVL